MPKPNDETKEAVKVFEEMLDDAFQRGYYQALVDVNSSINDLENGQPAKPLWWGGQQDRAWPILNSNILLFRGQRAVLRGHRYPLLLKKLLDARGQTISSSELEQYYGGGDEALRPAIYALRKILKKKMPEIEIISDGKGYFISVS